MSYLGVNGDLNPPLKPVVIHIPHSAQGRQVNHSNHPSRDLPDTNIPTLSLLGYMRAHQNVLPCLFILALDVRMLSFLSFLIEYYLFIYLLIYLSMYLFICAFIYCLSIYLSVSQHICRSVGLCVCLCLLSIYLSIYLLCLDSWTVRLSVSLSVSPRSGIRTGKKLPGRQSKDCISVAKTPLKNTNFVYFEENTDKIALWKTVLYLELFIRLKLV